MKRVPRIDFRDKVSIGFGSAVTCIHVGVKVSGRGVESGTVVVSTTGVGTNVRAEGVGQVGGWEVWVGRVGMGPDLMENRDGAYSGVGMGAAWSGTREGPSPRIRVECHRQL